MEGREQEWPISILITEIDIAYTDPFKWDIEEFLNASNTRVGTLSNTLKTDCQNSFDTTNLNTKPMTRRRLKHNNKRVMQCDVSILTNNLLTKIYTLLYNRIFIFFFFCSTNFLQLRIGKCREGTQLEYGNFCVVLLFHYYKSCECYCVAFGWNSEFILDLDFALLTILERGYKLVFIWYCLLRKIPQFRIFVRYFFKYGESPRMYNGFYSQYWCLQSVCFIIKSSLEEQNICQFMSAQEYVGIW